MSKQTFIVDTNVALRYFHTQDKEQTALVSPYFENDEYHLVVTSEVLCEMAWVLKKTIKVGNAMIIGIMEALVKSPNITITNLPAVLFGIEFVKHNGDFADGVITHQALLYDHAKLLTFDKKAQKLAQQLGVKIETLNS